MDRLIESISDMNLDIKKCIHQYKIYDVPTEVIITDVKHILTENLKLNNDDIFSNKLFTYYESSIAELNKSYKYDNREEVIQALESVLVKMDNAKQAYTNSLNLNDDNELEALFNTYYTIENLIYESYKSIYDSESNYIEELLNEIDVTMEAGAVGASTVVKKAGQAGATVVKTATKVWETLLNFLKNLRQMFMSKHKKINERDAQWLKDNQKTLMNINTNNMEINIHSDYKRGLNQAKTVYNNFKNIVNNNTHNNKNYEEFKKKIYRFADSNGDLKVGLSNLYRTGNVGNQYSIQTMRGTGISSTIGPLIEFCNGFIASFNEINKELNESEKFIKQLEREVKNRGVSVNESYCYIEDCLYDETELGVLFDFSSVMEAEQTGAQTINNSNTTTNTTTNNATTNQNKTNKNDLKDDKVGVKSRDHTKETTDSMNDSQLSMYNKICKDKHLGITTYLTTMEKKYFESITILRGLLKNKE